MAISLSYEIRCVIRTFHISSGEKKLVRDFYYYMMENGLSITKSILIYKHKLLKTSQNIRLLFDIYTALKKKYCFTENIQTKNRKMVCLRM